MITRGINSMRGGGLPKPTKLQDESYLEFVETFRDIVGYRNFPLVAQLADQEVAAIMGDRNVIPELSEVKGVVNKLPIAATWQRFMRSHQEMMWRRTRDTFLPIKEQLLNLMDVAASSEDSNLNVDMDFEVPEYARKEIHLQPGGYTDDPIGGVVYHYGTKVFYAGTNDNDEVHAEICSTLEIPNDGKVEKILDLGCSIGQATLLLEKQFPDAEVIGLDVSLPLLKYANWRSMEINSQTKYIQGLSEKTNFKSSSFDVVLSYILFHEIPVNVIKETISEAFRIIRPGGKFCIYEFPSASENMPASQRWMIDYDSINNCEPYSPGFVYLDFKGLLEEAGFTVKTGPKNSNPFLQTIVAEKIT